MKKSISTRLTKANIAKVMELLAKTPQSLVTLSKDFTPETMTHPLRAGDRSFMEIVVHILNCEERTTESIYAALLLHEPLILDIHAERQWGKLLRYEQFECAELLTYLGFRRKVLLQTLDGLTDVQWERAIQEAGKQRKESVYWRVRGMALHEAEHLDQIETRFGTIEPKE